MGLSQRVLDGLAFGVGSLLLGQEGRCLIIAQLRAARDQRVQKGPGPASLRGDKSGFSLALLVQKSHSLGIQMGILRDKSRPALFASGDRPHGFNNVHSLLITV